MNKIYKEIPCILTCLFIILVSVVGLFSVATHTANPDKATTSISSSYCEVADTSSHTYEEIALSETEASTIGNSADDINTEVYELGVCRVTAYCPKKCCCGESADGLTSTMVSPEACRTVAVDPDVIPYGSYVFINGDTYIAEDTGGAIKGNRIDIFFDTHEETVIFGVRYLEVSYSPPKN